MTDLLTEHLNRLSGRTRENAAYELRRWLTWLEVHDLDPLQVTTADVDHWTAHLSDDGLAPITISTQLGHVRRMYRWLWEDGTISEDPTRRARMPIRVPVRDRAWLGPTDLRTLLIHARHDRDRDAAAMIHLHALSGTRAGETRTLNVPDLSTHEGAPVLRITRSKQTGRDRLPIPQETADLLEEVIDGRTSGPMFTHPTTGERITKSAARHRLMQLISRADLPPVTPQGLRVGFITNALALGVPEREVMIAAGHATSSQTARYDRLRDSVQCTAGLRLAESILQESPHA